MRKFSNFNDLHPYGHVDFGRDVAETRHASDDPTFREKTPTRAVTDRGPRRHRAPRRTAAFIWLAAADFTIQSGASRSKDV
jgi:hypothetical protein